MIANLRWNENAARFATPDGRFVPVRAVREACDLAINEANKRAVSIAGQLSDGTISLAQFEQMLRAEALKGHIAAAMAGKGGKAQLNQADYGRIGQIWRAELEFLRQRCRKIASGEQPLNGTLKNIAQLYIEASRTTFHKFDDRAARAAGFDKESNVEHGDESCTGCRGETARGEVDIGELIQPGDRTPCGRRCKCSKTQRNSLTGEVRQ